MRPLVQRPSIISPRHFLCLPLLGNKIIGEANQLGGELVLIPNYKPSVILQRLLCRHGLPAYFLSQSLSYGPAKYSVGASIALTTTHEPFAIFGDDKVLIGGDDSVPFNDYSFFDFREVGVGEVAAKASIDMGNVTRLYR